MLFSSLRTPGLVCRVADFKFFDAAMIFRSMMRIIVTDRCLSHDFDIEKINKLFLWTLTLNGERQVTVKKDILQERVQLLQSAIDSAQLGLFQWDIQSNEFHCENSCIREILGLTDERVVIFSRLINDIFHPKDVSRFQDDLKKCMQEKIPLKEIYRICSCIDENIRWITFSAEFEFDQKGEPLRLVGLLEDVTKQKQNEIDVINNEVRFRAFITASSDVVYKMSPDWKEMRELQGRKFLLDTKIPDKDWLKKYIHPEDQNYVLKAIKEAIRTKGIFELEHRVVRLDGTLGWTYSRAVPVIDDEGNIIEWIGAAKDITENKKRDLELIENQKKMVHADKLAALGKLSASIAHEFNGPLQAIMTILRTVEKSCNDDEQNEMVGVAIDECNRVKRLIQSLQNFSRPSSSQKSLIDIHEILNSLLLLYKSDFKRKKISVDIAYDEKLPMIQGVPDQIKQVFLNILSNAADSCFKSGGVITISTSIEESKVAVSIRDTGIGIKEENLDKIFQPFYTTKPDEKGTGLGLAISYKIVESHGGTILVQSEPGIGSIFEVRLPIGANV